MINSIIRWSIKNRPLVLLLSLLLAAWGLRSLSQIPLDAIPDLSDVQVIIKTSYPGQAPQVVEDQITYPLTTAMLGVPGAKTVRGYSYFGDSFVYILFDDDTDPYWARSRVLEYLSEVEADLPTGAKPSLGPDASGVGWVYEYALLDRTGQHDLGELRGIQDWFLRYELENLPGVSEVAAIGGMVKQYQIVIDPVLLRRELLPLSKVIKAIRRGNQETGASVIEMSEAEYMIRVHGYITSRQELEELGPVGLSPAGTSLYLKDIAEIREGPEIRRGIAELDGMGEVVGGIVVMRWQENALDTISAVKQRLEELKASLPEGVEIIETYDRSRLIKESITTLSERLIEEIFVVFLVCLVFLMHMRSSLVIIFTLPLGVLIAFIVMRYQGVNANIMSLGGIAIAIGAMLDAAIVMVENAHRHLEKLSTGGSGNRKSRISAIIDATTEVGPPLFFSLLIITLSFIPVFALQAQEGRLFAPLAFTKTYAMAAAAGLSITLVPVLMVYFIKGKIKSDQASPINRYFVSLYQPIIEKALDRPSKVITIMLLLFVTALWPWSETGSEFMPELNEGDLLYMPTTFPGISIGKARELLQQTDRLIKTVPEVKQVFGKIGRAETATDPAPLTMIETTIQLKPRNQWREGMTIEKIKQQLDETVDIPGVANAWLMPIGARIDMLSTGVKTPVGIRISGPDLDGLETIAKQVEQQVRKVKGTTSVIAERVADGRYIDIKIDRYNAGQHWLNIADIQEIVASAVGGVKITESIEGRERYPVNIRYPRELRDSLHDLRNLPIITERGEHVSLSELAEINLIDGPSMIKSENGRLSTWIYVDMRGRDLASYVEDLKQTVNSNINLPAAYSLSWTGQYEYYQRAKQQLLFIIPLTLVIIFIMLYLSFHTIIEPLLVMISVPFALLGGIWLVYLYQLNLSVAVAIGFIALAGIATEFGVVMLVYLNQALKQNPPSNSVELKKAVIAGAVQRVRPKTMTVAVIVGGLLPIMMGHGAGLEVMRPIAVPLIGGMLTAPLVSMILIPVLYYFWKSKKLRDKIQATSE